MGLHSINSTEVPGCNHTLTVIIDDGYSGGADVHGDHCDCHARARNKDHNLKLFSTFPDGIIDYFHLEIIVGRVRLDDNFVCGHNKVQVFCPDQGRRRRRDRKRGEMKLTVIGT